VDHCSCDVAGWYHSACTVGPDEKPPICTGTALHSTAATFGNLMLYKLYAHMYGGKQDGDRLCKVGWHAHMVGEQKFVNLFDIMLSSFCKKGHHVTCDSIVNIVGIFFLLHLLII
jgi:hypothetical protein